MAQRDEAAAWRVNVLEAMMRVLVVAGPAILVTTLILRRGPRLDSTVAFQAAAVVVIIALRFARGLPFALRAGLSIAMVLSACFLWIARAGPSIGATAGVVASIVFSVMLLGRRVGLGLLFATGLALLAVGAGVSGGHLSLRLLDTDPSHFRNWLRWAVSFTLLTGSLAVAVDYVVGHIQKSYDELRSAYDELGQLNRKLETAKEEERRYIARELHDDLGQALTVLKLGLKTGKTTPFSDPLRIVDGLIVKVRELSRALRPALLDEIGLAPALSAYLEEQSAASGVVMELAPNGFDERLSPEMEIACFRLVQEAVTNAMRHAEAKSLKVRLERSGEAVHIAIEDDGRGLPNLEVLVRAALEGHMGVIGMRERVRALRGTFRIRSEPGQGTTIEVELPLSAPA